MDGTELKQAPIRIGDKLPQFTLPAYPGGSFSLDQVRGRTLILFFYPQDDTPGCTAEACGFRDQLEQFHQLDCSIYGVSQDGLESHAQFAAKFDLPFPLISDTNGELRRKLGNPDGSEPLIARVTYIVDGAGVVRHIVNGDRSAEVPDHISQALEWAQRLAAEQH